MISKNLQSAALSQWLSHKAQLWSAESAGLVFTSPIVPILTHCRCLLPHQLRDRVTVSSWGNTQRAPSTSVAMVIPDLGPSPLWAAHIGITPSFVYLPGKLYHVQPEMLTESSGLGPRYATSCMTTVTVISHERQRSREYAQHSLC
jgi:hypothetical protein